MTHCSTCSCKDKYKLGDKMVLHIEGVVSEIHESYVTVKTGDGPGDYWTVDYDDPDWKVENNNTMTLDLDKEVRLVKPPTYYGKPVQGRARLGRVLAIEADGSGAVACVFAQDRDGFRDKDLWVDIECLEAIE